MENSLVAPVDLVFGEEPLRGWGPNMGYLRPGADHLIAWEPQTIAMPEEDGAEKHSLFVGNLPYGCTEDELHEMFSKAGLVTAVRIVHNKQNGRPTGYAFCDFADRCAMQAAFQIFDGSALHGRRLRLDSASRVDK